MDPLYNSSSHLTVDISVNFANFDVAGCCASAAVGMDRLDITLPERLTPVASSGAQVTCAEVSAMSSDTSFAQMTSTDALEAVGLGIFSGRLIWLTL